MQVYCTSLIVLCNEPIKTSIMLVQKTTHAERIKNGIGLDQLLFSLYDLNILGFKKVLSEEGTFMGRDKMKFLAKLNSRFNELKEEHISGISIHSGICIDTMPGCEVFEARYGTTDNLLDETGEFLSYPNTPARKGEVVFRFAFQFKDGKVISIKSTGNYLVRKPVNVSVEINNN